MIPAIPSTAITRTSMYMETARHEAFADHKIEEKRAEIFMCGLCPMNIDSICVPYQTIIENGSDKPGYCRYIAVITGGDNL